jgi:Arc/MetJ-type ribon-helix-helix transcriptional regulator
MYHLPIPIPITIIGETFMTLKFTTVSIPKTLANHVKNRIKGTPFHSPSAFVTHVLEELEKEIEQIEKEKASEAGKD